MFAITVAAAAVLATSSTNPAYEAQLDTLVGQDYRAAVEMFGIPERRDLREGGGEVWTFRSRSEDGDSEAGPVSEAGFAGRRLNLDEREPSSKASSGQSSGQGGSGSSGRAVVGSTDPGNGLSATRTRGPRVCTTRIGLEPDGTIDGYAYQGVCLAD